MGKMGRLVTHENGTWVDGTHDGWHTEVKKIQQKLKKVTFGVDINLKQDYNGVK